MKYFFYKLQILTAVMLFLTPQLSHSQEDNPIKGKRPSINLAELSSQNLNPGQIKSRELLQQYNLAQRLADYPRQVSVHNGTPAYSALSTTSGVSNTEALSLPYFEGFEGSSTIPAGWTQEVVNGPLWTVGNGNSPYPPNAYVGSRNLVFRSYVPHASGLVTRLVMPALDLTSVNTAVLKFTYVNPYTFDFFGYQDVLSIKYKSALEDDWTTLQTFSSDVKEWTDVFITLPNPSASYYIAFEGASNAGIGISIDEIAINEGIQITSGNGESGVIYPLGEVLVPIGSSPRYKIRAYYHFRISSLVVDGEPIAEAVDQTDYYYSFPSVNAEHTIMAYFIWSEDYTVTGVAVPSEAGSVDISGNLFYKQTIQLSAFESGTRYYFSHWSSNGDSISAANPFNFVLLSDTTFQANYKLVVEPLTLPVYEGFEAANTIPYGWTEDMFTGPHWTVGSGNAPYPPNAYAGNNNLVYRSDNPNASGLMTRLITRQLDMTGINTPVLKFYYVNAEHFTSVVHQDQLTVRYKAAYDDPWTTLATFNSNVTDWTEVSIVLPEPSDSYFIAFEGTSNAGYGISIDEITINEQQLEGFFITAGAGGNGSINPSGQVFVPGGETKQFDVVANDGYHISSLLVDNAPIAAAEGESQFVFTFTSVVAEHTIMAYFMPDEYSVTVNVLPFEAGSVSVQGELYYGNTITLWPMSAGDAYVFSNWTSNGVTISTANPFSFVLQSDTLIEAHFTENNGGTLTLPFYEGFEAGNNIPYNWTQMMVSGSGPYLWYIGQGSAPYPPTAYAGNNNLVFKSNDPSSSGQISQMITPELDMTGTDTAILKFYFVNAGYFYIFPHQDQLSVKYKTEWSDPWTTLQTFNSDVREWTEVSIELTDLSDTYYIAFEGTNNAGYGISIDEITINGNLDAGVTKTLNISGIMLEGLYNGGGTMRQAQSDLGAEYGPGIADVLTVELHNASNYNDIVYTATNVMLGTNGIASVGDIPATIQGNYWVTVKHRNSVETTSAGVISFSGNTIGVNFLNPAQVFGNNLGTSADGHYLIFSGDINQDGVIDTVDMTLVDNDASNFASGYLLTDINGDSVVDISDMTIIDNNASAFKRAILP
ncbi:MAG: choice-of-anchor J domain-containing protein [Lentimicrobium sp.]|jgi:hypothetical protein|nr:choice-of-anchor J domain-containing protein [Lentimicrobium sp.]